MEKKENDSDLISLSACIRHKSGFPPGCSPRVLFVSMWINETIDSAPCHDTLHQLCDGARRASVGDCLVCASRHQAQLNSALAVVNRCWTRSVHHNQYPARLPLFIFSLI